MTAPVRRRWRFEGRVQGVGFRYFSACAAQKLGLTGWVANNWDGSVTLEAQGDPAQLEAMMAGPVQPKPSSMGMNALPERPRCDIMPSMT